MAKKMPFTVQRKIVADAGGTLIGVRFKNINRDLKLYAPGCGAPTHVVGTNGGEMPCGARLTGLDGKTEQYFCATCERDRKCEKMDYWTAQLAARGILDKSNIRQVMEDAKKKLDSIDYARLATVLIRVYNEDEAAEGESSGQNA